MSANPAPLSAEEEALSAAADLIADITAWAERQGGLPQTLADRASWWRLDVDPALRLLDSLDAAWAEAEAALPEGFVLTMLGRVRVPNQRDPFWQAYAEAWIPPGHVSRVSGEGPTPAAALRTLAARLSETE